MNKWIGKKLTINNTKRYVLGEKCLGRMTNNIKKKSYTKGFLDLVEIISGDKCDLDRVNGVFIVKLNGKGKLQWAE